MRMPGALRRIDDKVLGDRLKKGEPDVSPADDGRTEQLKRPTAERGQPRIARPAERPAAERPDTGQGLRETLTIVYRISQLVLLLLAVIVVLGIVFTLAPTNEDNVIVRNALSIAEGAAGPFKDVFTVMDKPDRELTVNYGFAAAVYLLLSFVVGKLPGGK